MLDDDPLYAPRLRRDKKKGIRPFIVTKIRGANRHRAARGAVFSSLISKAQSACSVDAKLELIRTLWFHKLLRLHKAGWANLKSLKNLVYMRNCPPFGVITPDKAHCCRKAFICPFCYARERVTESFIRAETVLYGVSGKFREAGPGSKALPVIRQDLQIVAYRLQASGTKVIGIPLLPQYVKAHFDCFKLFVIRTRRYEFDTFKAEYGTTQFTLYPLKKGFSVWRCGVMLVPGGLSKAAVETYERFGGVVRSYEPSKGNLTKAFSWAYQYPGRLLKDVNETLLVPLLVLLQGTRLISWFGGKPV